MKIDISGRAGVFAADSVLDIYDGRPVLCGDIESMRQMVTEHKPRRTCAIIPCRIVASGDAAPPERLHGHPQFTRVLYWNPVLAAWWTAAADVWATGPVTVATVGEAAQSLTRATK